MMWRSSSSGLLSPSAFGCLAHTFQMQAIDLGSYCIMQDVGFDYAGLGGKDNQVIDVYFHHHFPKAVSLFL